MTPEAPQPEPPDYEAIAKRFHYAYERLASHFGYETRPETATAWTHVPESNRLLMCAVVAEVVGPLLARVEELKQRNQQWVDRTYKGANPTPPAKVLNDDGSKGRVNSYRCSFDFKRRIVTAEEKRRCGKPGAWKKMQVEQWIGYSADEDSRVKQDTECRCSHSMDKHPLNRECEKCDCQHFDRWRINVHPLIDMGFNRKDTIRWFTEHGHPVPARSACWFCPNSSNARWRMLQKTHPDLFERACIIDETIRLDAGFNQRGDKEFRGTLFLHDSLKPLRDADLRDEATILADDFGIVPMFDFDCNGDSCDT